MVFDLGGVVMDSPLHAIARYERDHHLTPNAINRPLYRRIIGPKLASKAAGAPLCAGVGLPHLSIT